MTTSIPSEYFRRIDETADELFYSQPRFVTHIDDRAIAKLGEILLSRIPQSGVLLDLMSSWRSHIPDSLKPSRVVGLGLNRAEMDDNPALSEIVVHNVNREPRLPFDGAAFDAAILTVSVQYLVRPIEVFADVGRVLRAGAPFIVSFSNRMFPTKATAIWMQASESQRVGVVSRYFMDSAAFERIEVIDRSEATNPPSDPIWAVLGHRRPVLMP